MKNIILFHANCTDGAGAMWSAWKHFNKDADYEPVDHTYKNSTKLLELCKYYENIYMCDLMLSKPFVQEILDSGSNVYSLDHHKSNIEEFDGFTHPNFFNHNDLDKSGAGLSWDYFNAGQDRPLIIDYIEDFDLWRWKLDYGKEIYAYTCELNFNFVQDIIDKIGYLATLSLNQLRELGRNIIPFKNNLVEKIVKKSTNAIITIADGDGGYTQYCVPIVNSNLFTSEVGNILSLNKPFSIIWYVDNDGTIKISLRSDENGVDVSKIAAKLGLGGGGHAKASGTKFNNIQHMLEQISFV